jgi:predicted ATPase/class 3 adenylate cyclase
VRGELPSGTVTFLFTDIEGSTRLLHTLGPDAYADALAEHRRVLRDAFAAHGGVEVDTQGDAFFVAFPTAEAAAQAALETQGSLSTGPVSVRMGLHTGTPTRTGEGYVGIDLHRGARVAALAHGGQVVVSPATAALLDGADLRDLGLHRLKDFEGATRLWQLGEGEFPPLRTPGSVDLPVPATRFLGRERELFEAVSLVYERDPRVLTILGPGGTGKTRFAIELARLLAEDAEGGTVFVPLAPLRDTDLVVPALADRLGATSPDAAAVAARVGDRRTHAVVDNLEHLLPDAARPLADVAATAPALRLLVTSREALRVQGEHELDLPPLADDEAVELFCERARAVRANVRESAAVRELCARLDQLPLALELAAARTKLLSPEALLERLADRLDLLKGARDVDERHATLRATIAWSYDLLADDEQRLFRRLAMFRGGCTLESAEAVCDADLDTLASLLDKSLLRRRTGRLGEERFWMLETIREFAAERLEESGDVQDIRRRHAERMLEIAERAHLSEDDDEPFDWRVALAEREDLRAALDWAAQADVLFGLELASNLEAFWGPHAPAEGVRRISDLLGRGAKIPPRLRARALRNLAGAAHQERDYTVADSAYEESLRIFTELGDERGAAQIRTRLAYRAMNEGEHERARALLEESQHDARGRFPLIETQNATLLAHLALAEDRLDDADAALDRSRELGAVLQWGWQEAIWRTLRLWIALRRGQLDDAERQGRAALSIISQAEHALPTAIGTVAGLAQVALARDDLDRAGVLWGAVAAHDERMWGVHAARGAEEMRNERRPAFIAAFERGLELDLWEAAAIALGEDEAAQTVP